jgi:hypothetical protein
MEWMDKLKDVLKTHIFNGLSETYRTVNGMTGGKRTLMAFQVALDGIRDLSRSKLDMDYKVLLQTLNRNNYDAHGLEQIIKSSFYEYAKKALQSAGLNCDQLNLDLIDVPNGMDFIHSIYINAAREVWMQPHLFSHEYPAATQLENQRKVLAIVDGSIEKSVRDGVDLNKIITAYQTGTIVPTRRKVYEPTLKEQFNRINHNRSLLDSPPSYLEETDHDDEDLVVQVAQDITRRVHTSVGMPPPTPSTMGGGTIDNDAMAPNSETISSSTTPEPDPLSGDLKIKVELSEPVKTRLSPDTDSESSESSKSDRTTSIHSKRKQLMETESAAARSRTKITHKANSLRSGRSGSVPAPSNDDEIMVIKLDPGTPETHDSVKIVRRRAVPDDVSVYSMVSTKTSVSSSGDSLETVQVPKEPHKIKRVVLHRRNKDNINDDLPDNIGEPADMKIVTIGSEPNRPQKKEESASIVDDELDIMFMNSGKPKPKPKPEADTESVSDVKSFIYTGKAQNSSNTANEINVRLIDEEDEVESRLSRLRSRKNTIIDMV